MENCIFCNILAGKAPASEVYRDEVCVVFMDIHPVNPGHMLVTPCRHTADLAALDPEDGAHIFRVAQRLAQVLRESDDIRCEGVNLFLADGEAAGQEVFHVHLHVIPRFAGDGFGLKFNPAFFGDLPSREELDRLAEKVKSAL